jgi:hypothetical protein
VKHSTQFRDSRAFLGGGAFVLAIFAIGACVGDDSSTAAGPGAGGPDAAGDGTKGTDGGEGGVGVGDGGDATMPEGDANTNDASDGGVGDAAGGDANANDASDGGGGDAGEEGGEDAGDAGMMGEAGPDAGTPVCPGTPTVVTSAANQGCNFVVWSVSAGQPPAYSMCLGKQDQVPGSCPMPFAFKLTDGYAPPAAAIAVNDSALVVAFAEKPSPSGESIDTTTLLDLDRATGTLLNRGGMFVKGTVFPPMFPPDSPTTIEIMNQDVVLTGSGEFWNASGTGQNFKATYLGFIVTTPTTVGVGADSANLF